MDIKTLLARHQSLLFFLFKSKTYQILPHIQKSQKISLGPKLRKHDLIHNSWQRYKTLFMYIIFPSDCISSKEVKGGNHLYAYKYIVI
jgi:hypothetical protein